MQDILKQYFNHLRLIASSSEIINTLRFLSVVDRKPQIKIVAWLNKKLTLVLEELSGGVGCVSWRGGMGEWDLPQFWVWTQFEKVPQSRISKIKRTSNTVLFLSSYLWVMKFRKTFCLRQTLANKYWTVICRIELQQEHVLRTYCM